MQLIEFRGAPRWWRWSAAAVFLLTGVLFPCFITFGMGWDEFGRRYMESPRGRGMGFWATGDFVIGALSLAGWHYFSGRTFVGADGIRTRTPLRRRFIPWGDIKYVDMDRGIDEFLGRKTGPLYRIRLDLVNGESLCLPAPMAQEFDSAMEAAKSTIMHHRKAWADRSKPVS
ncbi:PH domain-containing protein [Streptomyces albireticuli]|uniref:PH domain-containing protein n=1 Tax=Streptomyces albireticuli TaxID=1940 RepID=UPI0036A73D65